MSKYLILIALHKRLKIARRVFENLARLEGDFMVFCICSSQDEAELCTEFGHDYTIEDNFPLGRKMNKGLLEAMKFDFEYLMQLGSDDIITQELFNVYNLITYDYFGLNSYHLVDEKTQRAKKFIYGGRISPIMHPVGAGRVFKKEILKKVLLHKDLWKDDAQRILDNSSDMTMLMSGYRAKIIDFQGIGIIDIKSEENLWNYDDVNCCEDVNYKELEPYL